ncbi:MAG: TetR/AcrR family transcriptional regulator [Thermoanaerobaculia bacterium]
MPTYQKPPTVNDDARAQDIYREAARVISDKGFDATSMGDIAETVDLTKGGLYYYIKGKKALLYAIMNFALDLLEQKVMAEARAEKDPEQRLARLLGGYVQLVLDEPDSMAILVSEEERLDPSYRPRVVERKRAHAEFLRDCIAAVSKARGRRSKVDPTIGAYCLLGMVHGVVDWFRNHSDLSEAALISQIQELALHGLNPAE